MRRNLCSSVRVGILEETAPSLVESLCTSHPQTLDPIGTNHRLIFLSLKSTPESTLQDQHSNKNPISRVESWPQSYGSRNRSTFNVLLLRRKLEKCPRRYLGKWFFKRIAFVSVLFCSSRAASWRHLLFDYFRTSFEDFYKWILKKLKIL